MKRAREDSDSKASDQGLMRGLEQDSSVELQDTFTPIAEIAGIVEAMRESFQSEYSMPLPKRKEQLVALRNLIDENKVALAQAVELDMGRHPTYSLRIIGGCVQSTDLLLSKLDEW